MELSAVRVLFSQCTLLMLFFIASVFGLQDFGGSFTVLAVLSLSVVRVTFMSPVWSLRPCEGKSL